MSETLRIAVVDAGVMGSDHARPIATKIHGAELAAVAEIAGRILGDHPIQAPPVTLVHRPGDGAELQVNGAFGDQMSEIHHVRLYLFRCCLRISLRIADIYKRFLRPSRNPKRRAPGRGSDALSH